MQTNELITHLKKFRTCHHMDAFTVSIDCPSCAINTAMAKLDALRIANDNNIRMFQEERRARMEAEHIILSLCAHFPKYTNGPACTPSELLKNVTDLLLQKPRSAGYLCKEIPLNELADALDDIKGQGYFIEHIFSTPSLLEGERRCMVVGCMERNRNDDR